MHLEGANARLVITSENVTQSEVVRCTLEHRCGVVSRLGGANARSRCNPMRVQLCGAPSNTATVVSALGGAEHGVRM